MSDPSLRCGLVLTCTVGLTALFGRSAGADTVYVDLTWISQPASPLPDDVRTIVVRQPAYRLNGFRDGIVRDSQRMWYRRLRSEIEIQVARAAPRLIVQDYDDRDARLDDADDQRAGAGRGAPAGRMENLADVHVIPRFTLAIDEARYDEKSEFHKQLVAKLGSRLSRGLLPNMHGPRETIWVRTVTVVCEMDLTAAATGAILVPYSAELTHHEATSAGWFGYGDKNPSELQATATVIDNLIEQHVLAFVGLFLPVERKLQQEIKHASDRCAEAVRQLNAGHLRQAGEMAAAEWRDSRQSDHRAAYVAGLASEFLGRMDLALKWYGKAVALKSKEEYRHYQEGLERVRRQVDIAGRPDATQVPESAPKPQVIIGDEASTARSESVPGPVVVERTLGFEKVALKDARLPAPAPPPTVPEISSALRLPPELQGALRKAGELRAIEGRDPWSAEDLLVQAVEAWLDQEAQRRGRGEMRQVDASPAVPSSGD